MSAARFKSMLLLFLAALGLAALVFAQVKVSKSYKQEMDLGWRSGELELSMTFAEVFNKRHRKRLKSGFTSQILVHAQLLEHKKGTPLAQAIMQYKIIYDMWEEKFVVRSEGPTGDRDFQLGSMEELVKKCGALDRLQLTPVVELPSGMKYRIEVRIVVNPMSERLRKKVREYLSNPDGSSHIGSPRSFFGSFSKIFVDEKAFQADAVYTYRSPKKVLPAKKGSE
jgi:hypothetical protein